MAKLDKKAKTYLIATLFFVILLAVGLVFAGPANKGKPACKDGKDNDGDGLIDYPADPGCTSPVDRDEFNPPAPACSDGVDNDGDGLIDFPQDPGCIDANDNDEFNEQLPFCGDGVCNGQETCSTCSQDCGQCDSCTDTDGGFVPTVQGTVSGFSGGQPFSKTDSCLDTRFLNEHLCSGTTPFNTTVDCLANSTTQCLNGACV